MILKNDLPLKTIEPLRTVEQFSSYLSTCFIHTVSGQIIKDTSNIISFWSLNDYCNRLIDLDLEIIFGIATFCCNQSF